MDSLSSAMCVCIYIYICMLIEVNNHSVIEVIYFNKTILYEHEKAIANN